MAHREPRPTENKPFRAGTSYRSSLSRWRRCVEFRAGRADNKHWANASPFFEFGCGRLRRGTWTRLIIQTMHMQNGQQGIPID